MAREVFGANQLPGVLIVDRYNGYHQTPCAIQYCHARQLRAVQDLGKLAEDETLDPYKLFFDSC